MEFFNVNDIRLAVDISGPPAGPPLVLLHGGGLDKSSWAGVSPTFARTHRLYAVDLRGFGDSDRPGTYSFEAMRDDVIGVLDHVHADRVDLIGHSMGGSVAWLVAQEQPHRIAHLVVEDTPPPRANLWDRPLPDRPAEEPPFDWDALAAILGQLNSPDPRWWPRLKDVSAPTLLIGGGPTSHVPQDVFAEVLELLPDGNLIEIPVGHHIHHEAPQAFLAAVLPFLAT